MTSSGKRYLTGDAIPLSEESSLSKHESSGSSGKRKSDTRLASNDAVKRRKSRWSSDDAQLKRLGPLHLPDFEGTDEIQQDLELQELNRQLMEINNKLLQPEVMNILGCGHAELINQKQQIMSKLVEKTFGLKSQSCTKSAKLYKKLYIPERQYPGYNFIGLILGPRGTTLKRMETETGAKILIRGKGSIKENKPIKNNKTTDPSDDDDLHVRIEATNQKSLDAAVEMVEKLLVPVMDCANDLKRKQLYELAVLNGKVTTASCDICGDLSHSTQLCPLITSALHTEQQGDPLSGLGAGNFSVLVPSNVDPQTEASAGTNNSRDEANLFVGYLPDSIDEVSLKKLFDPFGTVSTVKVVRDHVTGVSKGHGFVKYSDPASAAIAIEKMHGFQIGNKTLAVRVAGRPPTTLGSSALPTGVYPASPAHPQPTSAPTVWPALPQHSGYTSPTFPSFHPPVLSDVHPAIGASSTTSKEKGTDEANLFVGYLPDSIDEVILKLLFDPFGTISSVKVVKEPVSGVSKGCAFVRYSDPASAAIAIEKMHGFRIGNKALAVRVAGRPPTIPCSWVSPIVALTGSSENPQATLTPSASPVLPQHSGYTTPTVPSSHPLVPNDSIGASSSTSKEKGTDEANLFVGYLPDSMDEVSLKRLFDPYGTISGVKVARDPVTNVSKRYGFVRYRDPASASIAIEKMHGLRLGDKTLAVRVAGRPPATPGSSASAPAYSSSPANQATSIPTVWPQLPQDSGHFTPALPSFRPSVPVCLTPAAHVPPMSLAACPSVLGPSPSGQAMPLAADRPTFPAFSGLAPSAQPMFLAADHPTIPGYSGLASSTKPTSLASDHPTFPGFTPSTQPMPLADIPSLYPGNSPLTTPAHPMHAFSLVPGCSPFSSVQQPPSLGYGPSLDAKDFARSTTDASSTFSSTILTSSSLPGVKFPGSLGLKDIQRSPIPLHQASASLFLSPVTPNITGSTFGTENFPGDPDIFRSRLL